ncbi:cytotoxic translational repressor of toxin-antitoxin stability system [Bdellovibrionota bacterium FG-2]
MACRVTLTNKAIKQVWDLPANIKEAVQALIIEIEAAGPVRGNWSNYSKLGKGEHHCHLTYRYVACWLEFYHGIQLVEVYYVGTREKAPY